MEPLFKQMTIVGVGQLGGSLAQACRRGGIVGKVVGFGRNRENLEKAKKCGITDDWFTDLADAVKEADLVVLCTPVGDIVKLIREMIPALREGCILTDVGSVKAPVVEGVEGIERILDGSVHFVGSHPIAGSQKSGFAASNPELFKNAKCIVTPTKETNPEALRRITEFWQKLCNEVVSMDAKEHDFIYGAVSHLPHVVAFALMNTVTSLCTEHYREITSFGGNGFEDIKRLALSEPVMWKDICIFNKEAVLNIIEQFEGALGEIKSGIGRNDEDHLVKMFSTARENFTPVVTEHLQARGK